jgi:hypothetical protein
MCFLLPEPVEFGKPEPSSGYDVSMEYGKMASFKVFISTADTKSL